MENSTKKLKLKQNTDTEQLDHWDDNELTAVQTQTSQITRLVTELINLNDTDTYSEDDASRYPNREMRSAADGNKTNQNPGGKELTKTGNVDSVNARRTAHELIKCSLQIQQVYKKSGNFRRTEKEHATCTMSKWREEL